MPSFPFDKTDYETVAQDNQLGSDCCDGLNPLSAGLTSSELYYIYLKKIYVYKKMEIEILYFTKMRRSDSLRKRST